MGAYGLAISRANTLPGAYSLSSRSQSALNGWLNSGDVTAAVQATSLVYATGEGGVGVNSGGGKQARWG